MQQGLGMTPAERQGLRCWKGMDGINVNKVSQTILKLKYPSLSCNFMAKMSIDSMGIIDAILHTEVIIYIQEKYNNGSNVFLFSLKQKEESVKVLVRDYGFNQQKALDEFDSFIGSLPATIETYEDVDKHNSNQLISKYSSIGCHYPDSLIIAHLKRLGVVKIVTRDGAVEKVVSAIGITYDHMPTLSALLNRRF